MSPSIHYQKDSWGSVTNNTQWKDNAEINTPDLENNFHPFTFLFVYYSKTQMTF